MSMPVIILRYCFVTPLLLRKGSSELEELSKGGLLLGAMETISPYEQEEILLKSGDLVVCYTDGVNEAMNKKQEEFGEERLYQLILQNRDLNSNDLMQKILSEVSAFANDKLGDDLTLLIFKVN